MKRRMALLLTALMIVTLFTGCSPKSADTTTTNAAAGTEQKEEVADKELVVAVNGANNKFDPYDTNTGVDLVGLNQVYDTLVTKDNNGKIVPSLAEKYEISEDAKTYTFWLKKGVKFSNGLEFKAADAKFCVERGIKSSYTSLAYADVASCEVVDDYTFKINLKVPSVAFLEFLTSNLYGAMLNEETVNKYGDQFAKTAESAIGTGPYILKEWKPNDLCVFEANPNYFKGEPNIKKVRFKSITDANATVIALQTGEVDLYLWNVPGVSVDSISKNEKLNLATFSSMKFRHVAMNCETGIFKDVRMRQAVAYAVDREMTNIVGTEGHGVITDSPAGPDYIGNPNTQTWYKTDIEKAKQLVKEAGMEGKSVAIKTWTTDPFPKLATALQDNLNKIGLKVEVEQMEFNAFIDEVWNKGQYEICVVGWTSGTKDMDEVMSGHLAKANLGAAGNIARYTNPAMEELLTKAKGETDTEARKQLYAEAIKLYTEEAPEVPLYFEQGSRAYSKNLVIDKGYVEYDRIYDYNWGN